MGDHSWLEGAVGVVGTAILGVVGWVWRLGDRVTTLEVQRTGDDERLDRMEAKIDRLLERR